MTTISNVAPQFRTQNLLASLFAAPSAVVSLGKSPDKGSFLRLECVESGVMPIRATMAVPLMPITVHWLDDSQRSVHLRTFRYMDSPDSDVAFFYCARCGHHEFLSVPVLRARRPGCCVRCKALPIGTECRAWHAFGACDFCTERAIMPILFGRGVPSGTLISHAGSLANVQAAE